MFLEKFFEFYNHLIEICQKKSKDDEVNIYNLNDKSISYVEKHILTLIDTTLKKFLETNNDNQKYSFYLKMIQNVYCDISEFSKLFPNFKPLKIVLRLYFIILRTYYYNNQKFGKILSSQDKFILFIDYFFKEIFIYTIKTFPNLDINDKKSIIELNLHQVIYTNFLGMNLPFINNDTNQIPPNVLYNINDYRYEIMKDIKGGEGDIKKYFEKQNKCCEKINQNDIHLCIIKYCLNEIKDKFFVERFVKYLELNDDDKKIVLNNNITEE